MDGRTYPSNPQQLHLTVREKKRQPRITLPFELLEVRFVDGWRVVVRWVIMSGSQLGRHGGRGCRERGKREKSDRRKGEEKVMMLGGRSMVSIRDERVELSDAAVDARSSTISSQLHTEVPLA